jgi:hypothetical protein
LQKGLSALLLSILHQHAPFQSILAMAGDLLFGVGPWSAYLTNGFLVIGLVLVLLAFTRSLQPVARFAIIAYVVSLELIGNLVTEFRPDFYWGLLCGTAIYLMLSPTFLHRRANIVPPAVAVVFALLAKPSASPAAWIYRRGSMPKVRHIGSLSTPMRSRCRPTDRSPFSSIRPLLRAQGAGDQ